MSLLSFSDSGNRGREAETRVSYRSDDMNLETSYLRVTRLWLCRETDVR